MTEPSMAEVRKRWLALAWEARQDVNVFIELTQKNDQAIGSTPAFKQQWFHREWQRMWQEPLSVLHGATGFGKSEQLIALTLWELGNWPTLRTAFVRHSFESAKKLLLKVKRQIEQNEMLRAIFPRLRPGDVWNTEALRVQDAGIDTTSNSVGAYGTDAGQLLGDRVDRLNLDDIENHMNTLTEEARAKNLRYVDEVTQTRVTTHGKMRVLANAWHPEDAAHTMSRRPGIVYAKYPAENLATGELLWPDFRNRAWLDAVKGRITPTAYARAYLCQARDEGTRVFKGEWIAKARALGAGSRPRRSVERAFTRDGELRNPGDIDRLSIVLFNEWKIIIGVDLATGETQRKRKTDFTAFFVIGLDNRWNRHVLWLEKGRWSGPEILYKMRALEERYHPDLWMVETNGTQRWMLQFAQQIPDFAPVQAHHTDAKKWDESLGIEGIGVEMMAGRWVIPSPMKGQTEAEYRSRLSPEELRAYEEITTWQTQLLDFQRGPHTPDAVMAAWFAQRGAERIGAGGGLTLEDSRTPENDQAGAGATVERLFAEEDEPEMPTDHALRAMGFFQ